MLNFLINFSLMVFICYAVSWSARTILFGGKKRKSYAAAKGRQSQRTRTTQRKQAPKAIPRKKQAQIIRLRHSEKAARRNLRAA